MAAFRNASPSSRTTHGRLALPNLLAVVALVGCIGPGRRGGGGPDGDRLVAPLPVRVDGPPLSVEPLFEAHRKQHAGLSPEELRRALGIGPGVDAPLSFSPTRGRYYGAIADRLQLTSEERAIYRAHGVVSVDHGQRYSMASAYYAIYTRDLPILVTTDSVLHALHRSYGRILKDLESYTFSPLLAETLEAAHRELAARAASLTAPALRTAAADVDVHLTVARSLLAGTEVGAGEAPVVSPLGNDADVGRLLSFVASLEPQRGPETLLRGGRRAVDYSQFRPRGHYTESEELQRYFRALMWLGRADLGFVLDPPDSTVGLVVDADRELRAAALLTWILRETGGDARLAAMSRVLDFLVGRTEGVTADHMRTAVEKAEVVTVDALAAEATLVRVRDALVALVPSAPATRSQVLVSREGRSTPVANPQVFRLFGQRFLLDAFLLSRLVFDAIEVGGKRVKRFMPTGLDVMAALGNDEAVRLLAPELDRFPYAANLLAARRVVDAHAASDWQQSAYNIWLDALRTLDEPPPPGAAFPEVMQRTAWRRKQLQTQLASWAELRHDTLLYGQQSYTAGAECEYPDGYVEPYPEFFLRLRLLATEGARLLSESSQALSRPDDPSNWLGSAVTFLRRFAATMEHLESLARKELASQPFSEEDRRFLKAAVDKRAGGSGPPSYDGWYPRLIRDADPAEWKPIVADVHTDPNTGNVLEVGVGDVNFLVVAVDNAGDRAAYVGPVFSYHEFTRSAASRLTDEDWGQMIRGGRTPPRPDWGKIIQALPKRRTLESSRERN